MTQIINILNPIRAANGSLTACVELTDGRSLFLHSMYDPEQEARDWLKTIDLVENTAYVVYGFGLGYHVKALLKKLPDNCRIIVLEHSLAESLAKTAAEILPDSRWMTDKRIMYLPGPDTRTYAGNIAKVMEEELLDKIITCAHYPSMQIFQEMFATIERELIKMTTDLFTQNTNFAGVAAINYIENSWNNLPYIWAGTGAKRFEGKFAGKPAIIVAAGPSLNKNIGFLKELQDKALIVAAGTAIGALKRQEITPHFVAAMDPFPFMYQAMQTDLDSRSTLIAAYDAFYELVANYPGPRCFTRCSNADGLAPLEKHLPTTTQTISNVSVSSVAVDFARQLGANPIILIGQDMALSETASHAEGVRTGYQLNDPQQEYPLVQGQNGEWLRATWMLKDIRDFFVGYIRIYNQHLFVNATEGGAFLPGATHMTLAEAAEKFMGEPQDFFGEIRAIIQKERHPAVRELVKRVDDFISDCGKIESKLQTVLANYIKSDQLPAIDMVALQKAISDMEITMKGVRKSRAYPYLKFSYDTFWLMYAINARQMEVVESYDLLIDSMSKLAVNVTKANCVSRQAREKLLELAVEQGGLQYG
jgi:hypothetical protein